MNEGTTLFFGLPPEPVEQQINDVSELVDRAHILRVYDLTQDELNNDDLSDDWWEMIHPDTCLVVVEDEVFGGSPYSMYTCLTDFALGNNILEVSELFRHTCHQDQDTRMPLPVGDIPVAIKVSSILNNEVEEDEVDLEFLSRES